MDRPIGVIIIAALVALNGIVAVVGGAISLSAGQAILGSIITMIFGLALLYVAWGLWTLRHWAWLTTIVIEGLSALFALISLFGAPGALGPWISLVLAAIIIFYLTRPEVREAFRRPMGA